jgi:NADH-quinone oxidoreductase subunit L
MLDLLWLIPALPAAGFVVLTLVGGRLSRRAVSIVGAGSVGLAFVVAALVTVDFLVGPPGGDAYRQVLWTWFHVAGLRPQFALYLDAMSLLFVLVITFVGFLIHLYSTEFMEHEDGFTRFFIYMDLFVASMLLLVLADDLLVLYMGWEGVGLCSYLLIGFWYKDAQNGYAARKAFIVTRIGDTAMIVGLFLLFAELGTLQIQPLMERVAAEWPAGSGLAVAAALLLLGGAVGKSAQLPLQTWLPDAMAGPTPVSALIHAATMVTAGVYLVARTNVVFTTAPDVLLVVAIVGTLTLLYAGFSALAQLDLKRILAYSTISQIGYMFLALGVAGWSAGIFHFMTHAFFKALLFLAAGVVIEALGGEHEIFSMGGLRRRLPVAFWATVVGAASLAALPLVTAGFYSKDLIVEESLASVDGSTWLWLGAIVCSFLTGLYAFRLVFVVFFGPQRTAVVRPPRWRMKLPLVVLGVLAVAGGFLWMPEWLGGWAPLSAFLDTALPHSELIEGTWRTSWYVTALTPALALLGVATAWLLYVRRPGAITAESEVARFWLGGWGFDTMYALFFVRPVMWFARVARDDLVEPVVAAIAAANLGAWRSLSTLQSGLLRSYVAVAAVGVAVFLAFVVLR